MIAKRYDSGMLIFRILEVKWQYTLGQGETRIGKNRIESGTGHVKKSHELLIVKDV